MTRLQMSPDGRAIFVELSRPSLARDTVVTERWVRTLSRRPTTQQLPSNFRSTILGWSPDSKALVFLKDRPTGTYVWQLSLPDLSEAQVTSRPLAPRRAAYHGFLWSPDGAQLVYLAVPQPQPTLVPRLLHGVEGDVRHPFWDPRSGEPPSDGPVPPRGQIWVMDVHTGVCRPVTDTLAINVVVTADFDDGRWADWSPDGIHLAFAARGSFRHDSLHYPEYSPDFPTSPYLAHRLGIYVVDLPTSRMWALGTDTSAEDPAWSPDGGHLAYRVDTVIAVADLQRVGPGRLLAQRVTAHARGIPLWMPDGREVCYRPDQGLRATLHCTRVSELVSRDLFPDRYTYGLLTSSAGGGRVGIMCDSPVAPPEVLAGSLDSLPLHCVISAAELNPHLTDVAWPRLDTLSWRSADGKWLIHGIVLGPPHMDSGARYPLIVANTGGPSRVSWHFVANLPNTFPDVIFAERGYLVLFPNSRGRPGYGRAFLDANGTEHSLVGHMTDDALTGVDALVSRGIVDTTRLGITGFSWGGSMAELAVTRTDRFRAASLGDPVPGPVVVWEAFYNTANFARQHAARVGGWGNSLDSLDRRRMEDETGIYHADRVKTPTLLESGSMSPAIDWGGMWYNAMCYFRIPAEWVVYPRSGHGWTEPALMLDSFERNLAWFEYWLRDVPYPDSVRRREYEAWKAQMAAPHDPRWSLDSGRPR